MTSDDAKSRKQSPAGFTSGVRRTACTSRTTSLAMEHEASHAGSRLAAYCVSSVFRKRSCTPHVKLMDSLE